MKNKTKITLKFDATKQVRGHQVHVTGAGTHQDKRTARNRTRGAQVRRAIQESC